MNSDEPDGMSASSGHRVLYPADYISSLDASTDEVRHVLIALPGINSIGHWIKELAQECSAGSIQVYQPHVEWMSKVKLLREPRAGAQMLARAKADIRQILLQYPEIPVSVVAHSFGTKIVCNIWAEIDRPLYCAFFLGGVARVNDLEKIRPHCQHVFNDCGTSDLVPIVAEIACPARYQASGYYGFRSTLLARDRYFDYGHFGYVKRAHFQRYILPILLRGEVREPYISNKQYSYYWFIIMGKRAKLFVLFVILALLSVSLFKDIF